MAAVHGLVELVTNWDARLRGTVDAETRRCILGVDLLDGQPLRRPLKRLGR